MFWTFPCIWFQCASSVRPLLFCTVSGVQNPCHSTHWVSIPKNWRPKIQLEFCAPSFVSESQASLLSQQGKKLKKWKMRKSQILWYLCQTISNFEFFTPHIVKFDAGLVLFSSFFQFWYIFKKKKIFLVFCANFGQKVGKKVRLQNILFER